MRSHERRASDRSEADARRLTWTAYLFMACEGYLIYAVGFITAYLQADLGSAAWMAALPNSMVALGMLSGGAVARPFLVRLGPTRAIRAWAIVMAASAALLAVPSSLAAVLAGAFVFGVSGSGLLVHVNSALAGRRGGVLLVRANLWSVVGAVIGPLALSAAARSVGWSLGALVPVPLLLGLAFVLPASPARDASAAVRHPAGGDSDAPRGEPPLGRAYWLAWVYLALCTGAEFSFVAWGTQVAVERTGLDVPDATALASLFVVGMIVGRLAFGGPLGGRLPVPLVLRGSTLLAAVGAALLWFAVLPAAAGLALFLGGLGLAAIYPFGAGQALAHAPLAPIRASARLTWASAAAILVAPLLLGVVAGASGVVEAWILVLALLATAFAVLVAVPRPTARVAAGPSAMPIPDLDQVGP